MVYNNCFFSCSTQFSLSSVCKYGVLGGLSGCSVYKFQYGIRIDMLPLFIGCVQKILENVIKRMYQRVRSLLSFSLPSYAFVCLENVIKRMSQRVRSLLSLSLPRYAFVCFGWWWHEVMIIFCELLLDPNPNNVSKDGDHL